VGTQQIQIRAFAGSSVRKIWMPDSIYSIAEDAFDGVENLSVEANEGSYAYSWAVKKEYIKITDVPADETTQIVMPTTLQAGADLEIQVFGAENTVGHSVYLINNETHDVKRQDVRKKNGRANWSGYELDGNDYTVKVYTVTDKYDTLTPISKALEITGSKPVVTDAFHFPTKIGYNGYSFSIAPYEAIEIRSTFYDKDGNYISTIKNGSDEDTASIIVEPAEENAVVKVKYCVREDGLWSEWTFETSMEIVHDNYQEENEYLKSLILPETIQAGQDLQISFELTDNVNYYSVWLVQDNDYALYRDREPYEGSSSITIPGYKLNVGDYHLHFIIWVNDNYETVYDQVIHVVNGRVPAEISIFANKTEVTTKESVELQIVSDGSEEASFRFSDGISIWYENCILSDDGSGVLSNNINLHPDYTSCLVTISASVKKGENWSEWSDPVTVYVTRAEKLPKPVIQVSQEVAAGEDVIISVSNVDEADYYEIFVYNNITWTDVVDRTIYKNDSDFGKDLEVNGSLFENGTYVVSVYSYSRTYEQSDNSKKYFTVKGTRAAAPLVSTDSDEFRIKTKISFSIDTADCEQLSVAFSGFTEYGFGWENKYVIETRSNTTLWTYTFSDDAEGVDFAFRFAVKKDGKWTKTATISRTVLGLPQLDAPMIAAENSYQAGRDFTISFEPVEGATSYYYRLVFKTESNTTTYIKSGTYYQPADVTVYGYDMKPGNYEFFVEARADNYKSGEASYKFAVAPYEYGSELIHVSVDKTELYENDSRPVWTVRAEGAEALCCRYSSYTDDSWMAIHVIRLDEEGVARFTLDGYGDPELETCVWGYRFSAVIDGVWTDWTEPIAIAYKKPPKEETIKLENPEIHIPEFIEAGLDMSFSFDTVENATSYYAYISSYYGNETVCSFSSVEPDTPIIVSGRYLAPGTYVAKIEAYGTNASSSNSMVFKVTGQRETAPVVTMDKDTYEAGETIYFNIDTDGVDEIYVSYRAYDYESGHESITPDGSSTEWPFWIRSYWPGRLCEIRFTVKRGDKWSKWKTISISIPD